MADKSWKAFERRIAKRVGGKRIPVTGERDGADVVAGPFVFQAKLRRGLPSYLREWLRGITAAGERKNATGVSEIRQSLNELLGKDERSEKANADLEKLTAEGQKLETEIRAAIVAEVPTNETHVEGDAADVELRSLIHDASAGKILAAAHARRNTDGREAEIQKHFKLASNELPHAMLETRAQTEAPTNGATEQAPIIQPLFGMTAVNFLNIPMPPRPDPDS